tara:strand:+ start:295 stop:666 length:372 start_codon:yes stop_codon:yes gene_type:complete
LVDLETPVGQPQDLVGSYYELAMAVVRSGVVAYLHWRRCGYVDSDGNIDYALYWHVWKTKRTIHISKAKNRLDGIQIDVEFYNNGIETYLKALGYEKETDWLRKAIASRVQREDGADYNDCFS